MHKQTIALVDDDRNILTSLSIALEKEGFKVQTYLDGESALIGLTRTPPDLAVVDIKMPKMDGEELLKKLRKKTSLPVIFLTSKDDEVDELLGLKLGADDFIKKSGGFSIKVLVERIRVQLRKKDFDNSIEENKSIIAHGKAVHTSLETATILQEKHNINAEVVDLRSIRPLDVDTIVTSVKKTNRVLLVEENKPFCGVDSQIAFLIQDQAFDYLDAPIKRVSAIDAPQAYSKALENAQIPDANRVLKAALEIL